ncbi:MAG TPA: hypothetical protein VGN12_15435 [Pirellulales bacterium]
MADAVAGAMFVQRLKNPRRRSSWSGHGVYIGKLMLSLAPVRLSPITRYSGMADEAHSESANKGSAEASEELQSGAALSAFSGRSSSGPRACGLTGRAPTMKADEGRKNTLLTDFIPAIAW